MKGNKNISNNDITHMINLEEINIVCNSNITHRSINQLPNINNLLYSKYILSVRRIKNIENTEMHC